MFPVARTTPAWTAALSAAVLAVSVASFVSPVTAAADQAPTTMTVAPAYAEAGHAVRVRRTAQVAATAVANPVETGRTIRIRGTAVTKTSTATAKRRPVRLLEQSNGSWRALARKWTTRAGAYRFRATAGEAATVRVFRVSAPRFKGLSAARTGRIRVAVIEPEPTLEPVPDPGDYVTPEPLPADYQAAGSTTDWTYLIKGGSRWNPCDPIRWAYNPQDQGYAGLADVYRAFAKISGVSGLQFQYVGETSWRYLGNIRDADFPVDVDITVSWADESELDALAGPRVGTAGVSGSAAPPGTDVGFVISRGYLALDNGHALAGGFDEPGWGQVLLHETLHALGLGHAKKQVQLMYGVAHDDNTRFGAGDITGMTQVGLPAGCIS